MKTSECAATLTQTSIHASTNKLAWDRQQACWLAYLVA